MGVDFSLNTGEECTEGVDNLYYQQMRFVIILSISF